MVTRWLGAGSPLGWRLALGGAALTFACQRQTAASHDVAASASAAPSAAHAPAAAPRVVALVGAEQRRASRDVTTEDLTNHDARVRRAGARALARIADTRAGELLLASLGDDDPEVVIWSAYGLGATCRARESVHVRALVARGASLLVQRAGSKESPKPVGALLDPLASVADALGRCGGSEAESTLRAWLALDGPPGDAAGWALGTSATKRDRLEDVTLVALLEAASRTTGAVPSALQAFTRLSRVDAPVAARLGDVARSLLGVSGTRRTLAVRALALAGEPAAVDLGNVITSGATPAERADAARALGRLGAGGQLALADALGRLLTDPASPTQEKLLGPEYGVLTSVLGALVPPPDRAGPALARLAALPVGAAPAVARRTVALRCAAASLLAGRGTESRVLATCDPDPKGRAGRLAELAVLGRGPLRGARLRAWTALAAAEDTVVRERALELSAGHDEVDAVTPIARALAGKTAGEVATAAHLVAEHPARASSTATRDAPAPEVTRALTHALEQWEPSASVEVRSNLMDAAGALGLLTVKPRLEAACQSDNPTLRTHAESALHLLGDRERHCVDFTPPQGLPAELSQLLAAPVTLELETDGGTLTLTLEPALAPVAATRLVELAKAHFFDGLVVHRVVPGFVVQLGDPDGDGYGGAPRPALRCETSPAPFEAGSVGIALSGRDSGSSQFFVTLAREAHLDGEYALIGHAGSGWDRVAEGDIVKAARTR